MNTPYSSKQLKRVKQFKPLFSNYHPVSLSKIVQPGLSVHQLLDLHQAATPIFCLLTLLIFRPHNLTAYVFAALFSGNALITLAKEWFVPEFRFHQTATKGGTIGKIVLTSVGRIPRGLLVYLPHQRAESR